jgi:hypothetical protein
VENCLGDYILGIP